MKRDMELVRKLLAAIEEQPGDGKADVAIDGYNGA